jgi:hypothetical protein
MSLYSDLIAAGCEIDHHESDLYVKVTPQSRPIIERHVWVGKFHSATLFYSKDGAQWWDVPFAYEPFWSKQPGCIVIR